ncbi:MAG: hypothetical protein AB7R67_20115 [Vicinamibacterales bacterium]
MSTALYNDERFLELSRPKVPNGRDLWTFLLVGPFTSPVPGLVLGTLGGIADRLEWPHAGTRKVWEEIASRGMAVADWPRGIIWLPRGVRHNPPESPNVCKMWRRFLNEHVPQGELRTTIEATLQDHLKGLDRSEAFVEAFAEGFREAFQQALPRSFPEGGRGSFRESGTRDQVRTPPNPPVTGGDRPAGLDRPFTRRELAEAEHDLEQFRASQPKGWMGPSYQRPADYVDPKRCPHDPECTDRSVCLALFARARRERVALAIAAGGRR